MSLFLPLATCHGWSVNVKVLREWRVCLCACVNYTCTASALSAAASKRNSLFSTVDHADCRMLGRTSLPHGMVFHEDADPRGLATSVLQRTAPHFRRTGKNFPQATKSDIMYLGGVTLHLHAKATKPMHAKLKHQVTCRSRRCWKKIIQHALHGQAKASAYLSTVTKLRMLIEKSKFSSCGLKSCCGARHETNCYW